MSNFESIDFEEIKRAIEHFDDMAKTPVETINNYNFGTTQYCGNEDVIRQSIEFIIEAFKHLPEVYRESWALAAKSGWYVNWFTPFPTVSEIDSTTQADPKLNTLMLEHLKNDFKSISDIILEACPERNEILKCAFKLHKRKNYIAAIPLFLSQTDGICAEVLGAHMFTDKERRAESVGSFKSTQDNLASVLIDLLTLNTQFTAGIRCSSENKKLLAPNRNGIMHGSKKHLDYGTEINSYKAFSLLAFIVFVLVKPEW